jgi:hypothetical protein
LDTGAICKNLFYLLDAYSVLALDLLNEFTLAQVKPPIYFGSFRTSSAPAFTAGALPMKRGQTFGSDVAASQTKISVCE